MIQGALSGPKGIPASIYGYLLAPTPVLEAFGEGGGAAALKSTPFATLGAVIPSTATTRCNSRVAYQEFVRLRAAVFRNVT